MSEYQVLFVMQVHGCFASSSTEDYWLEKCAKLPFPPFQGMTFEDGDFTVVVQGDEVDGEARPAEIVWKAGDRRFTVYVASDRTLYFRGLKEGGLGSGSFRREAAEIAAAYVEEGWTMREEDKVRYAAVIKEPAP